MFLKFTKGLYQYLAWSIYIHKPIGNLFDAVLTLRESSGGIEGIQKTLYLRERVLYLKLDISVGVVVESYPGKQTE